jgi:hypothetical protein
VLPPTGATLFLGAELDYQKIEVKGICARVWNLCLAEIPLTSVRLESAMNTPVCCPRHSLCLVHRAHFSSLLAASTAVYWTLDFRFCCGRLFAVACAMAILLIIGSFLQLMAPRGAVLDTGVSLFSLSHGMEPEAQGLRRTKKRKVETVTAIKENSKTDKLNAEVLISSCALPSLVGSHVRNKEKS